MRKFFGAALSFLLLIGVVEAQSPFVSVSDFLAGTSAPVRVSGLFAEESFFAELVRPNGTKISFEETADDLGVSNFEISTLHTKHAGTYELKVLRDVGENYTETIKVFPGVVSPYRSKIVVKNASIAADGEQVAQVEVQCMDAFGNVIAGERVKVFSSRNEDVVVAQKVSDSAGIVRAQIKSNTPGVSTVFAIAGDSLLFEKPEVVFYLSEESAGDLKNAGSGLGDFLKAQLFNEEATGEVAYFAIEGLADEVVASKNATLKISAKNEDGEVVKGFLGKIRFSSSDDRANLPADYQFVEEDQGVHTFFLSTTFATPGSQTLATHDLNDFRISGEKTVLVTLGDGVVVPDAEDGIKITTPQPGTLKTSRITITGTSSGCLSLKLVDGDNVLISDLAVDNQKKFVFQTPSLADGLHKFKAICAENEELVSDEVAVRIDRTPPSVVSVEVTPSGALEKKQSFTIKVGSSEPLASAKCEFDSNMTELDLVGQNFVGEMTAPDACGEFPISCTVADLLGNELEEPNAAIITVCANEDEESVEVKENVPPVAVSNLSATPGENKVTLNWSPAVDDDGIKNYRVIYGMCGDDFNGQNIVPDNRTKWYVDNLESCEKYCFRVYPVDMTGEEGTVSNTVEGTPFCEEVVHASAPNTPKSGSETNNSVIALVLAVLAGGGVLFVARRREEV